MQRIVFEPLNQSSFEEKLANNIHALRLELDQVLNDSTRIQLENAINESESLIKEALSQSVSDQQKSNLFLRAVNFWLRLWQRHRNRPESIELIKIADSLTNYLLAYSKLYMGLSLINEDRTGETKTDAERIVSGFGWLAEVVDVYFDYLSDHDLSQTLRSAKKALEVSERKISDYHAEDVEVSRLTTTLRAYSGFIVWKIEKSIKSTTPVPWEVQERRIDELISSFEQIPEETYTEAEMAAIARIREDLGV